MKLKGEHVWLRALELEDLDFLYRVENDQDLWEVSNTLTPYSRYVLKKYLDNASRDLFEARQLRLAICKVGTQEAIGLVDLYDFDPVHMRAGIGIVIGEASDRENGYATEAISLVCDYAFEQLKLHQLYAGVTAGNEPSVRLFEKAGFRQTGVKEQWVRSGATFKDEILYQKINEQY